MRLYLVDRDGAETNKNFFLDGALFWPITPSLRQQPAMFHVEPLEDSRVWALALPAPCTATPTDGWAPWAALEHRVLCALAGRKDAARTGVPATGCARAPRPLAGPAPRLVRTHRPAAPGVLPGRHRCHALARAQRDGSYQWSRQHNIATGTVGTCPHSAGPSEGLSPDASTGECRHLWRALLSLAAFVLALVTLVWRLAPPQGHR